MIEKQKSTIGNYLNCANEQTGVKKGWIASECIKYITGCVKKLIAKGFVSESLLEQIADQLPPQGASLMNIADIQYNIANAKANSEMSGRTR